MIKRRFVSMLILTGIVLLLALSEALSLSAKRSAAGEEKAKGMEIGVITADLILKEDWKYAAKKLCEIDVESIVEEMGDLKLKRALNLQQTEALSAYEDFLENFSEHYDKAQWGDAEDFEQLRFMLVWLDNDEVPELALVNGLNHAHRVFFYTFADGEVVYVGEGGQYGAVGYVEREGFIFDGYDTQGNVYDNVYRMEGTGAIHLQSRSERWIMDEETGEPVCVYSVDGKEATPEEYQAACEMWDEYKDKTVAYDCCFRIDEEAIGKNLSYAMSNLVFGQEDYLKTTVLSVSGVSENEILRFEYDDFDRDGRYEAFAFLGEYKEAENGNCYNGELWFVSAEQCISLEKENVYRYIDGCMSKRGRKFIYFTSSENDITNISRIWTVRNGKAAESKISGIGEIRDGGGYNDLVLWIGANDRERSTESGATCGHTCKPYFYDYDWNRDEFKQYEAKTIHKGQLQAICGFDLAAEIEGEGHKILSILELENNIVVVNYAMYPEGKEGLRIVYDNVIWDCTAGDYWKRKERGVTSWRDAGFGGTYYKSDT